MGGLELPGLYLGKGHFLRLIPRQAERLQKI